MSEYLICYNSIRTKSAVNRTDQREVLGLIPGPVKSPLPDPGYWKVVGVARGRQPAIST